MAYEGYVLYDGVEIVNHGRLALLAQALGVTGVHVNPKNTDDLLARTESQRADWADVTEAPWYDERYPASAEFAGVLMLSLQGLDDSSQSAEITEYTGDGGSAGQSRNGTQAIVANAIFVGKTERGTEYGIRWVNRMLSSARGRERTCTGADLHYYRTLGPDRARAERVHRRDVTLTRAFSITKKKRSACQASTWITFTLTDSDGYEYNDARPRVSKMGNQFTMGALTEKDNLHPNPDFATAEGLSPYSGTTLSVGMGEATLTAPSGGLSDGQLMGMFYPMKGKPGGVYSGRIRIRRGAGNANLRLAFSGYDNGSGVGNNIAGTASTPNLAAGYQDFTFQGIKMPNAPTLNQIGVQLITQGAMAGGSQVIIDRIAVVEGDEVPDVMVGGMFYLNQAACPVYDYTPLFDPQYPALTAPPPMPDYLPDGWTIKTGDVFQRFWVRVPPVAPAHLHTVPVVRLESTQEARMVRVSVWEHESGIDDQCDPLWSAVLMYLPANQTIYIDGEARAAYAWDGVSPNVRRVDSLLYGPDAYPMVWSAFNDFGDLLVTLDIFQMPGGAYQGGGNVRASLSLVPRTD